VVKQKLIALTAELEEIRQGRQEDESKLKKLQEKLDYQEEHQAANHALNVLLMEKEVLIKNLETSIVSLETVCQESKSDKEAVKSRLEKEQEDFRASLDRLEAELADVKAKRAMLTNQVQALETQMKAAADLQIMAKTEAEELRLQLNRETALAAEKTAELEEVLVQGQELALKIDMSENEIGRLQQELEYEVSKRKAANATVVKV